MTRRAQSHIGNPNKFNARRMFVHGRWFHSIKEAKRYSELKLLERAGEISHLECQPEFPIIINGKKIGKRGRKYVADFAYFDGKSRVIEDCKGVRTDLYTLKKDLVEALYGIEIREV